MLALASTAAWAFQEQREGAPGGAAQAPATLDQSAPSASAPLNTAPVNPGAGAGTEIRIPGRGSLGVLPKMDFGLELLYGAADQKADDSRNLAPGGDDLAIKGTFRKRF